MIRLSDPLGDTPHWEEKDHFELPTKLFGARQAPL